MPRKPGFNSNGSAGLIAYLEAHTTEELSSISMRANDILEQLPPFVNTVPYGPAAERELIERGYEHFIVRWTYSVSVWT